MANDKEDKMTQDQKLRRMTESEEWGIVRRIFTDKIMDLQSIRNINPDEDGSEQIKARAIAIDYLMEFWREVNGRVEQHEQELHNELMKEAKNDYHDDAVDYSNPSDNYLHRTD